MHGLLLLEDMHAFTEGTDESLGRRLQWHTIEVILLFYFILICVLVFYLLIHAHIIFFFTLLFGQATQLSHIVDRRMKELSEDAN